MKIAFTPGRSKLLAGCICGLLVLAAQSAALPPEVVAQLSRNLPAAISIVPAAATSKIFPLQSERSSQLDRKYSIAVGEGPFSLARVGEGGKIVELGVRAGPKSEEFTNRWFRVDDVFGGVKWKLEPYTTPCQNLVYFVGDKKTPVLVGALEPEVKCASLGTITLGKRSYRLLQTRVDVVNAGGAANMFQVVVAREAPPVKTQAEYDQRAAELQSEWAYRQGRSWGNEQRSMLTGEACYGCAGMAADFAHYMFGQGLFQGGERYDDQSQIRAGDIVHTGHHFFAVIYRRGDVLITIEGNMNSAVNQSKTYYSMSGGKLFGGGHLDSFDHGLHYWPLKE